MRILRKEEKIAVAAAVVVAVILFFGNDIWSLVMGAGSGSNQTSQAGLSENGSGTMKNIPNISTSAGVQIFDISVGTGEEAVAGKKITVHYIGTLDDGTKFDSSLERNKPYTFTLGKNDVIKGLDMGVTGMRVGGIRRIVISPELGYGPQAIGPIPANSTLTFEIQLLEVK